MTTEAGSEAYHGEANVTFRDGRLNARNAFETTKSPEQRRIFEGSLSGPVGGGRRTSFLATADWRQEDLWAIVYAATATGTVQEIIPTPAETLELSGTLNHQIGRKHTLALRLTYQSETLKNEGVGGTTLPAAASQSSDREMQIVYAQRSILTPKLINQIRFLFGDSDNVAPWLSFAWAPGTRGTTVVRGGVGLFNDRLSESVMADVLRSREGRTFQYVLLDPGYPDPLAPGASIQDTPTSLVQLQRGLELPRSLQFSVGVDRRLWKGATLSVNYIESHGTRLMRSIDINAPPPPLYAARPDPAHGVIRQIESTARQESRSLQVVLRGKSTDYFNGSAQYVFGRSLNDTNGIGSFPANNYDLTGEWSRSSSDERHRFDLAGSVNGGRWLTIGVAFSARSGRPYSMRIGRDIYNNGTTNARPPGVPRNSLQASGSANLDLRWSHPDFDAEDQRLGMLRSSQSMTYGRIGELGRVTRRSGPFRPGGGVAAAESGAF